MPLLSAKIKIGAPPLLSFCGRVQRQQRMYSFGCVVLDLYIASICKHVEHIKIRLIDQRLVVKLNLHYLEKAPPIFSFCEDLW